MPEKWICSYKQLQSLEGKEIAQQITDIDFPMVVIQLDRLPIRSLEKYKRMVFPVLGGHQFQLFPQALVCIFPNPVIIFQLNTISRQ